MMTGDAPVRAARERKRLPGWTTGGHAHLGIVSMLVLLSAALTHSGDATAGPAGATPVDD